MTKNLMACRILESAELDLRSVMQSLANAQPDQLESAQRLLERMIGSLGEIEAAARRDTSLPLKNGLSGFRHKLGQASSLTGIALNNIERRATLAGLALGGSGSHFAVEG